jgi:saccharopine dehydrogenase (NAD+, L-lysine-forming)
METITFGAKLRAFSGMAGSGAAPGMYRAPFSLKSMHPMIRIGLIREGKVPPDNRVAFTPRQCADIQSRHPELRFVVQPSSNRCFPDADYAAEGLELSEDLSRCDILLGIKEVPIDQLIPGKTYLFFSHTKKKQPYNQKLMRALIEKKIRMVDYECLTYEDGQRILGFGYFAGVVGAHHALRSWGLKTGQYSLPAAHEVTDYQAMLQSYHNLKLPNVKIAVTGSGRVAWGILEVMNQLGIDHVETEDFLGREFPYPVYTQLKGHDLYERKDGSEFHRDDLHYHPEWFNCKFPPYLKRADILINGIYWDEQMPRLFEKDMVQQPGCRLRVISDVTCDVGGSVPLNVGASTIADPVYGIERKSLKKVAPHQASKDVIDIIAVDNMPNELPRDASFHFGGLLDKYVLAELLLEKSALIDRATICREGKLTPAYAYLSDYAYGAPVQ